MDTTSIIIGLIRDVVAAVVGLAILFGAGWTDEQVAGILLVVTTVGALGSYAWAQYKASHK